MAGVVAAAKILGVEDDKLIIKAATRLGLNDWEKSYEIVAKSVKGKGRAKGRGLPCLGLGGLPRRKLRIAAL